MLHLKTARLARWQVRLLTWSGGSLWATGAAWLLLRRFGTREGEFGPESSPIEPWMLRIHGFAMILALVATGTLLVVHVWRGWHYRSQRPAGVALSAAVIVLTLTGYLLYYAGEDWGRAAISVIHWALGLAGLPLFVWHRRAGASARRRSSG